MVVSNTPSNHSSGSDMPATQDRPQSSDPWKIEASPPGLIGSPIDFLFAEHHRQRQAVNVLHLIADGEVREAGVKKLIEFLKTDFAIHIADEELSFFPLLRLHCLAEDSIGELIERLAEEHKKDEATAASVTVILEGLLAGHVLTGERRKVIRVFAERIRQHLAMENAALLPIARKRLDDEALVILSEMMKERRNL